MKNWQNLYDSVEQGWITNESSLFRVKRKLMGKTFIGFTDEDGHEIIPCKYLRHNKYEFQYGLLEVVGDNEKIGFVNKEGEEIITCQYDKVSDIEEGLICVCKDYKWGAINTKGHVIVPLQYRWLGHMGHGRIMVQNFQSYRVGAIDYSGNLVIPLKYYQLGRVTIDNKIEYFMSEGGEHGFLDINGNCIELLPC